MSILLWVPGTDVAYYLHDRNQAIIPPSSNKDPGRGERAASLMNGAPNWHRASVSRVQYVMLQGTSEEVNTLSTY